MTDERDYLTEDEATRLWQRAAQLQAEEARRAEARAAAEAEGDLDGPGDPRAEGYALTHVRTAALEAGIGEDFVEAALAEVRSDRAMRQALGDKKHRVARWVLDNPEDSLTARRTISESPAAILAAMEALFPHEPYMLMLRERLGDPTAGGTLVFDLQGVGFSTAANPGFRGDASYADLRQVYVTLTSLPGDARRTEVTVRAPVAWALSINAAVSGAMTLVSGGISMMVSVGIGAALGIAGVLGPVGLGLLVATGGGLGCAGGLKGFRALYRYGRGRGTKALDGLLAAVAARAEGGWGIAPGGPGGALPPG